MSAAPGDTDERDAPGDGPGTGYVSSLIAVQRRHALRTLVLVLAGLAALLGAALVPAVAGARPAPFGWLVLTALVHPMWLVVAVRHVRAAEQAERDLLRAARRRRRRPRGAAPCGAGHAEPGDPERGRPEPGGAEPPDGGPRRQAETDRYGAGREEGGRGRRPSGAA